MKLFADFETTGFDPITNDIITGHLILTGDDLAIIEERSFKARPSMRNWSEGAEKVHGITQEEAVKHPKPAVMAEEIYTWLKPFCPGANRPEFVYHALSKGFWNSDGSRQWGRFDFSFLFMLYWKLGKGFRFYEVFSDSNTSSTIDLARKRIPKLDKYKLDVVSKHLGIELDHHEAVSDCKACYEIYKQLINKEEGELL